MSDAPPAPTAYAAPPAPTAPATPPAATPHTPPAAFTPLTEAQVVKLLPKGTDAESARHFAQFAATHKLGKDGIEAFSQFAQDAQARIETQRQSAADTAFQNTVKGWEVESKRDPTLIGGQGWDANVKVIQNVVAEFGGDIDPKTGSNELNDWLNSTGYGNHPVVLKMLMRLGGALPKEGRPVNGTPPRGQQQSLASSLFTNTK